MPAILAVLSSYPQAVLIEDCSHAHGATIGDRPVGTFGDGAIWSLQGQKIVSGGEGGISLTRHKEYYYRQLIWSHYNKRCKNEIPKDHPLAQYSLTGAGLKNRAHPLATVVALTQLRQLDDFLFWKRYFSTYIASAIEKIPFLTAPQPSRGFANKETDIRPAWYAYVMRFQSHLAPRGLTRERFVEALYNAGLQDFDIPRSTGLLHREPLFRTPWDLFPGSYNRGEVFDHGTDSTFPEATTFYNEAIKIPMWATSRDEEVAAHYAETLQKAAAIYLDRES